MVKNIISRMVSNYSMALIAGISLAGASSCERKNNTYNNVSAFEVFVSSGDTLECYAGFEGSNVDLSKYLSEMAVVNYREKMKRTNSYSYPRVSESDFLVSDFSNKYDRNGRSPIGRKLMLLDLNGDGRVGCKK